MAHPYKSHADKSGKHKMSAIHGKGHSGRGNELPNLYMNGAYKHVDTSTDHMQHKEQSAAPGMKKGGRLDHSKRHKSPIARGMPAAPPSPDMIAAQAGAGGPSPSPVPAPPPGMPMQKHGGRTHSDEAEDKALIKKMVKPSAVKRAHGGRTYPLTAGADTGEGRLELSHAQKKHKK